MKKLLLLLFLLPNLLFSAPKYEGGSCDLCEFIFPDGSKYIGQWKNYMRDGIGEMFYQAGAVYSGSWKNDKPNGQGEYQNGGEFKGDKYNGLFEEGQFKDGKYTWSDGNYYTVKWINGAPHIGSHFEDGIKHVGEFINVNAYKGKGPWDNRLWSGSRYYPDGRKDVLKDGKIIIDGKQSNLDNEDQNKSLYVSKKNEQKLIFNLANDFIIFNNNLISENSKTENFISDGGDLFEYSSYLNESRANQIIRDLIRSKKAYEDYPKKLKEFSNNQFEDIKKLIDPKMFQKYQLLREGALEEYELYITPTILALTEIIDLYQFMISTNKIHNFSIDPEDGVLILPENILNTYNIKMDKIDQAFDLYEATEEQIAKRTEKYEIMFNRLHHTFSDKSSDIASKSNVKKYQMSESQKLLKEKALESFSAEIHKAVSLQMQYPQMAQMRGWEGEVIILFKIDEQGALMKPSIKQSSGRKILDEEALSMVKRVSPIPKLPKELEGSEFSIHIPITFSLTNQDEEKGILDWIFESE